MTFDGTSDFPHTLSVIILTILAPIAGCNLLSSSTATAPSFTIALYFSFANSLIKSSSRAIMAALFVTVSVNDGLNVFSISGISVCLILLRVYSSSRFVASVTYFMPLSAQYFSISARVTSRSGRIILPRIYGIPQSPEMPLPLIKFISMVSALSFL